MNEIPGRIGHDDGTPRALTLDQFRHDTRAWLAENCPPAMRTPLPRDEVVWGGRRERFVNPEARLWLARMARQGWTAPTWPVAYGGAGLSEDEASVIREELQRIGARPPLISFALSMLGPALLEFADEAIKAYHLPRIARGEIRWCQGYSEPDVGSDLSAVRARAQDCGDHWLVNGTKIWTSYADQADWIFCLLRTRDDVPQQRGIGFLLIDMNSPGIATSAIRLISGASPFCQVFFADVAVPKAQMVGAPDRGWTIAKRLLDHERRWFSEIDENIGRIVGVGGVTVSLAAAAALYLGESGGELDNPVLRDRIAANDMGFAAMELTARRAQDEKAMGMPEDPVIPSVIKYMGARLFKERLELLTNLLGSDALGWAGAPFTPEQLDVTRQWLRSKANSIEGGTSEVQLNIIAKRKLALPAG